MSARGRRASVIICVESVKRSPYGGDLRADTSSASEHRQRFQSSTPISRRAMKELEDQITASLHRVGATMTTLRTRPTLWLGKAKIAILSTMLCTKRQDADALRETPAPLHTQEKGA
ncbi:hypothetical protein RJZ56_001181 [Blastomyces dermatitidis]